MIPRGVQHRPRAERETSILLIEPTGVVNTGEAGGTLTASPESLVLPIRFTGPAALPSVLAQSHQLAGQPGGSQRGGQYVPPTQSGLGAAQIGYS